MILDLSYTEVAVIGVAALLASILHGATGMAGGIVMTAILAHFISIKAAVPAMTIALILSHLSRTVMFVRETDWRIAGVVLAFGCPMIVIGAYIFGKISPATIASVFAVFLLVSFPVKYWARTRQLRTRPAMLASASAVWGMLAGNVIGAGFFLSPFLLGTGIGRLTFVGTLATVTLVMNTLKTTVFGVTYLLSRDLAIVGIAIGLISLPGNWIGRRILTGISESQHRHTVDILTGLMIVNFAYIAVTEAR